MKPRLLAILIVLGTAAGLIGWILHVPVPVLDALVLPVALALGRRYGRAT